jgi:hypothetical protein
MISAADHGEIIIYQPDDKSTQIEVRIDEDTVWLTQSQMVELFSSTKQNISQHITNIFREGELEPNSTVKEYLTVQLEGSRKVKRKITRYNLDVIISVGYRVKSLRGTQFRIWANRVIKEYLLKGYVINQRVERIEKKLIEHEDKFDFLIRTATIPREGIFFEGEIFDAYNFASDIIRSAKESIVLIDNFIDDTVFTLLSKRSSEVSVSIYTSSVSRQLRLDIEKFNKQYKEISVYVFTKSHDRFLIIDNTTVYHLGASLKDLGKRWFAFSVIAINAEEIISRLSKESKRI